MNIIKTKLLIELMALDLFCQYGYEGVTMRQLAQKVGIKESSIYKHYKCKKEIFDIIIIHFEEKMNQNYLHLRTNLSKIETIKKDNLIQLSMSSFLVFATDSYVAKCRKLFMISSLGDSSIGKIYLENFLYEPTKYNVEIFKKMNFEKNVEELDFDLLAYQFYSPMQCLLQEFDTGFVTLDEALEKIKKLVELFCFENKIIK